MSEFKEYSIGHVHLIELTVPDLLETMLKELTSRGSFSVVDKYKFACEETIHKKVNLTTKERKKYEADVTFVGTYTPKRAKLVKALERAKVKVYGPYWKYLKRGQNVRDGIYGPEMAKAFNAAKIVFNIHMDEDVPYKVNMRTFEAAGSGAFLLTDIPHGMENMFVENGELVTYSNKRELLELVEYYLNSREEREKIANRAQKRAYRDHIYGLRIKRLLNVL